MTVQESSAPANLSRAFFRPLWATISSIGVVRLAPLCALAGLVVAFMLRIHLLGDQNLWWDEGLAVWIVRQPLLPATLWTAGDVHPPLYFWTLWLWLRLAGESPFAMRFLTLLYGMLTVALAYPVGRRLGGPWMGLLALWLLALARFEIWWSQEMRMYMLAGFLGLLALYATLHLIAASRLAAGTLQDEKRRTEWNSALEGVPPGVHLRGHGIFTVAHNASGVEGDSPPPTYLSPTKSMAIYILAAVGAMYTIYLSALTLLVFSIVIVLAALARWLAGSSRQALALIARWTIANLAVIALFLPWLAVALPRMHSWSVASPVPFLFPFRLFGVLLTTGISTYVEDFTWAILVFGFVCLLGILAAFTFPTGLRFPRFGQPASAPGNLLPAWLILALLGLSLLLPPLAVYLLTLPGRIFYTPRLEARYFLPFAAPFYLLLAWALAHLWQRWRLPALVASLVVLALFLWTLPQQYTDRHLSDGYPSLVRTIRAYGQPGDGVVLVSGDRYPLFLYDYDLPGLGGYRSPLVQIPQDSPSLTLDNLATQLEPLLHQYQRLWLVLADPGLQDPQNLALPWLQQRLPTALDLGFGPDRLLLLSSQATPPSIPLLPKSAGKLSPQFSLEKSLTPQARLLGYDLPVPSARPGEVVYLTTYWCITGDTSIVGQWQDQAGRALAVQPVTLQSVPTAAGPSGEGQFVRHIFTLPVYPYTPAGPYRLVISTPSGNTNLQPLLEIPGPRASATQVLPKPGSHTAQSAQVGPFQLLGFTLNPAKATLSPGQTLTLSLDWRIDQRLDTRYTFFAHLLGAAFNPATNGPVWSGHDAEPLDGGYPTLQWFPGEAVRDILHLEIPSDAPPGDYQLEIGIYPTGQPDRLPVSGAGADPPNRRILLSTPIHLAPP
ncbi:MAG: hypothetical protein EXR62_16080 [Chloroflexi bacterium]|nr:hypothetical protein [Chloroflexota bacterium]